MTAIGERAAVKAILGEMATFDSKPTLAEPLPSLAKVHGNTSILK
jgi:hypothetical protein